MKIKKLLLFIIILVLFSAGIAHADNTLMYPLRAIYDKVVTPDGRFGYSSIATAAASDELGDSTTQFDITNPSGSTFRYTYDSTGTDPGITALTVQINSRIYLNAQNFNAANNGFFIITGSGDDYFEVTNASGVAENNVTIGTGIINLCSTFYVARGEYSETSDFESLSGQMWYWDNVNVSFNSTSRSDTTGINMTWRGKVKFSGSYDGYFVRFTSTDGFDGIGCDIVIDWNISTVTYDWAAALNIVTVENFRGKFLIEPIACALSDVNHYIEGVYCYDVEKSIINLTIEGITISTNVHHVIGLLLQVSDFNSIRAIVKDVTSTDSAGYGIYMYAGSDYNEIVGVSRGSNTNLLDSGTGNKTGEVAQ